METISELNERWWYRLLKVLFLVFSIFCYGIALVTITGAYFAIEYNKEEFFSNQKINNEKILLIEELKSREYTTTEINDALRKQYHNPYETLKLTREQFKALYGEYALENQDLLEEKQPKPDTPGTLMWLFLIVPSSFLITWGILQFIQRTFYYIILGKIKPEN